MSFLLGILGLLAIIVGGCLSLAALLGILPLIHFLLTLPMRRAERARLFLEMLDTTLKDGRPVEETILSAAQSRDLMMGVQFHLVAAWLEQGLRLDEALAKVPRFLPPQVNVMLAAGRRIGDLTKVLPACYQLLKDAVSQTRSAINYLVILTFVLTPVGMCIVGMLKALVLPKFLEIGHGMGMEFSPVRLQFLSDHFGAVIAVQCGLLLIFWLAAAIYIGGPRVTAWFPALQRVQYWMPWRRKRLQRDFSTMLAILTDSGLPEPEAVALAADCTANNIFRHRAVRALDGLRQGMKLADAVRVMDDSGEFGWRLANANHGGGGFLKALAGWHESLDAKAFQEEQAAAHGITTGVVLWSGLFVGFVVISVFGFLVSITNAGVLW